MMRLNGTGYGHGDGDGYGHGDGYGYGDGYGDGYGTGTGTGYGYEQPHATCLWVDDNLLTAICQRLLFKENQP